MGTFTEFLEVLRKHRPKLDAEGNLIGCTGCRWRWFPSQYEDDQDDVFLTHQAVKLDEEAR